MAVHYTRFDGQRVSRRWAVVLKRARKDGIKFKINSGHRTIPEQLALFRQNMQRAGLRWVQRPGRPLTAWPTPLAPHIRTGNPAHALDVQTPGAAELAAWLRRRGIHVAFPVPGEAWHMEVTRRGLTKLWRRYR
jgi:hypothetical protein